MIGGIKSLGVVAEGVLIVGNGFGDLTIVAERVGEMEMGFSKNPLELNVGAINFFSGIQVGQCFLKPS